MKNTWFKHYNSAHEGLSMINAIADGKYMAICMFWIILELVSKHEKRDKNIGEIEVSPALLKALINTNERGLISCLNQVSDYFGSSLVITWSKLGRNLVETRNQLSDGFVHILVTNWFELQENMGGKKYQKGDRSKKEEVRSKKEEVRSKNKEERGEKEPSFDGLPPLAIIWNQNCGKLTKVSKTNAARNKKAAERFKEDSPDGWAEAVRKLAGSSFCHGNNKQGWKCTFDFLLKPESRLKALEGVYDDRSPKKFANERDGDLDAQIQEIMKGDPNGIDATN